MNRFTKILFTSLLAIMFVVPVASARPGRVIIRGGFGGWGFGPAFYGPGFGWYGPGWYGPYGAYYVGPGEAANSTGEVKIDTKAKDAMVYVDGGYAGTVGNLKTFHLKAGEHDIELRDPSGHSYYQEHINVVPGKTLKLNPNATQ
jgi:hypothetical protein